MTSYAGYASPAVKQSLSNFAEPVKAGDELWLLLYPSSQRDDAGGGIFTASVPSFPSLSRHLDIARIFFEELSFYAVNLLKSNVSCFIPLCRSFCEARRYARPSAFGLERVFCDQAWVAEATIVNLDRLMAFVRGVPSVAQSELLRIQTERTWCLVMDHIPARLRMQRRSMEQLDAEATNNGAERETAPPLSVYNHGSAMGKCRTNRGEVLTLREITTSIEEDVLIPLAAVTEKYNDFTDSLANRASNGSREPKLVEERILACQAGAKWTIMDMFGDDVDLPADFDQEDDLLLRHAFAQAKLAKLRNDYLLRDLKGAILMTGPRD